MKFAMSLRLKLFIWYIGSLTLLAAFFFLAIHFNTIPYSIPIFITLFFILSALGLVFTIRISRSITKLSSEVQSISGLNLDKRVSIPSGNDEISKLAGSFNGLLDRVREALKREQQFIADTAHELKTPMATIQSTLEVSLNSDLNKEEYRKVIKDTIEEASRVSATLKNVLDLAWSESPDSAKNPRQFNLSDLMQELVEIAEKLGSKEKIAVRSQIEAEICIKGFKDKLARALLNILDNAVKYNMRQGTVEVTLKSQDKTVIIKISDTGRGIAHDDLNQIFERFYRGTSSDQIHGTGLGLAIAKSVINLHGGQIEVESTVGKGTVFKIRLPLLLR